MMTKEQYISDLAIPPGEYLQEVIDDMGISQLELSERMGRPAQKINEIIKGNKQIIPETAIQLEKVLNIPAQFWNNLEAEYRLILAKQKEEQEILNEVETVKLYPYAELVVQGLVKKTRKATEKVKSLRKFFGVSSLSLVKDVHEFAPAFRQQENPKISGEALSAWLHAGRELAKKQNVSKYDAKQLRKTIPKLREMTFETEFEMLLPNLQSKLSSCGIALVILPHFKNTYVNGATFWHTKDKATIIMTLRGKKADIFWFSLFHEIAHILLHDKRTTFLESENNSAFKKQEHEADNFSSNTLIPETKYREFISRGDFSEQAIFNFSEVINIHAGIITGRLQHDNYLTYRENYHKISYTFLNKK
ncbi:MAG: addiction module antidote protein, HigA family [Gammaproteobacteria bacterium]|nr:MAG: addiction module antidote protein, HigA family [Gammaproteobacteria bacterium]